MQAEGKFSIGALVTDFRKKYYYSSRPVNSAKRKSDMIVFVYLSFMKSCFAPPWDSCVELGDN